MSSEHDLEMDAENQNHDGEEITHENGTTNRVKALERNEQLLAAATQYTQLLARRDRCQAVKGRFAHCYLYS